LEPQGVDGRKILNWTFEMWGGGLDRSGSGLGEVAGCCEGANEPSVSVKCGEFLG
jgi:hypothetical protein